MGGTRREPGLGWGCRCRAPAVRQPRQQRRGSSVCPQTAPLGQRRPLRRWDGALVCAWLLCPNPGKVQEHGGRSCCSFTLSRQVFNVEVTELWNCWLEATSGGLQPKGPLGAGPVDTGLHQPQPRLNSARAESSPSSLEVTKWLCWPAALARSFPWVQSAPPTDPLAITPSRVGSVVLKTVLE